MTTPFPGMDPYLERRGVWSEVHTRLIVAIADELGPKIRPQYRVGVDLRTYLALTTSEELVGVPDVLVVAPSETSRETAASKTTMAVMPQTVELPMPEEIVERYLEIRDVATGEVIIVIEILSLANKLLHEGRKQYENKRLAIIGSRTNRVEIDLLRAGKPLPMRPLNDGGESDYRILVSRASRRPHADAYLFNVRDPIPDIPIPLRPGETEPLILLNPLLHDLYDRAGFDLTLDYSQPPQPSLRDEDAAWAKKLLQQSDG